MAYPIAPSTSPGTGNLSDNRSEGESEELSPAEIEIKVDALIALLERQADRRVGERRPVEQRWVRESYQFHGKYLDQEIKDIQSAEHFHRSTVYLNETRRKSDAMEDRIIDIEFPADDRNFSIEATAVPELSSEALAWSRFAAQNQQMLLQIPDGAPEAQEAIEAQRESLKRATESQASLDEASKRSKLMQAEMDDMLQECLYSVECKKMIHDGVKLGTGIMKGPVLASERKQIWMQRQDEASGFEVHEMVEIDEQRPAFYRVDPWNFFPDMSASTLSECESFFERHLLTASGLRKLARLPGFDKNAIRDLIKEKAKGTSPHYISELKNIADDGSNPDMGDRYHVWEFHGPVELEEMNCVASYTQDEELQKYAGEVDPLQELNVTVWFCQGKLLKFGIHPLDSGEPIYSVFNYKKDDHSIFGFGVPNLMASQQEVVCAGWRMMVDNAKAACIPQFVINTSIVEPYDGTMDVYPGKWWRRKSGAAPGEQVFETYHLDIRQAEMRAIIEMALQAIDREIGVPTIAEADPGIMPMQTALGVSVFSNEQKIPFKALVKRFDDDVTGPVMRRLFNWIMQFSEKEHIKGDMRIKARGTSTFLLRELQAPALMAMLTQFAAHPVLGPALKIMPMVRMVANAMLLPQHEVVKSDEQMAADLAAAAQQEQEPTIEEIKLNIAQLQHDAAIGQAEIRAQAAKYTIDLQYEIEKLRQEMRGNANLDSLQTKKEIEQGKIDSGERKMAADIGMAERLGKTTGGYV